MSRLFVLAALGAVVPLVAPAADPVPLAPTPRAPGEVAPTPAPVPLFGTPERTELRDELRKLLDTIGNDPIEEPKPVVPAFPARAGRIKEKMLKDNGGTADSERAVALGLAWLARQQWNDGSWSLDRDNKDDAVGTTALALLPFLGAGQTHKPTVGNKYQKAVQAGLAYLIKACATPGPNAGRASTSATQQALAALTLCEAYGLTFDPAVRPHAQATLNYLHKAQAKDGGWAEGDGASDLAVTGWVIQALDAGRLGGLVVDDRVVKNAVKFLDARATGEQKAAFGTTSDKGAKPGTTATATGLLCRYLIDEWRAAHAGMTEGAAGLAKNPPGAKDRDALYVYHASWVLLHCGGDRWREWNEGPKGSNGTRDLIAGAQHRKTDDAKLLGSWDADAGAFGTKYGRIGTTALNLLALEVYYRHAPRYKKESPKEG
ncbi:MAG: terpene cyclase/mutase family protein [Planctomycetes bacterium]|nr:terpene cyclase/mutase family protein [Planctomycetota bacterium]